VPSPTALIRVVLQKNEGGTLGSAVAGCPAFPIRRSTANLLTPHLTLPQLLRDRILPSCAAMRIASRDWISGQSALLL
jgi:hypothetical protein